VHLAIWFNPHVLNQSIINHNVDSANKLECLV